MELHAGTVTFLFTDIEGSTELLRQLGDGWGPVRAEHRRILREAAAEAGGREVDTQGDSFFFVFVRARDAVAAAAKAQRGLADHTWPDGARVRVRMGVHTGEPTVDDEGYLGLDVVRGARICAAASGGQVLVSETTRTLLGGGDDGDAGLHYLGERELKGLPRPERLYELVTEGAPAGPAPPAVPASPAQEDTPLLAGGVDRLTERMRDAAFDLRTQIQDQVERDLRRAGVPLDLSGRPPEGFRVPSSRQLLASGIVAALLLCVIAAIIILVVLLLV